MHAPAPPRGFTLVEVLVVVVILGVLAATVSLTLLGSGGERQLERDARQLSALLGYACERAELTGRPLGLSLVRGGYVFSEHAAREWQPITDGELRPRHWSVPLSERLSRDGVAIAVAEEAPAEPPLLCLASGELTPFRLELALADHRSAWRLSGEPDGKLTLERSDAP
jgi:general secretion pathway protein H